MRFSSALLACVLLVLLAPLASGQHKTEKHPDLGIAQIERPRLFDPVPVQPTEPWIRLYYKERKADPKRKSSKTRRFSPELYVIEIPRKDPPKSEDKKKKRSTTKKDRSAESVVDFRTYVEHIYNGDGKDRWKISDDGPGKKEKTHDTRVWSLTGPKVGRDQWEGWAYTWTDETKTVAVLGICLSPDSKEMVKLWKKTGERLKLAAPVESSTETTKWERRYARSGASHPEFRIQVRKDLVEPWKAEDTENFIVIYNTKDQPLLKRVMRDLELCREQYIKLFPPAADFDAVSAVRICKNRDEYLAYGGSPRSAGYWNFVAEELVLYNAEVKERGKLTDDTDTFIVLYHEAFHQYIHYSTGELPPHSWFNEGYGDFFSGAQIKSGKFRKIGVNPWRLNTIQYLIENGMHTPWKKIIRFEQSEYYANGAANYAQGWSMIYFLNTSPKVKRNERWAAILPTYFETLKSAYAKELEEAGHPKLRAQREGPGKRAREAAVTAAFEGVDLDALEDEWKDYISELTPPKK